MILARPFAAGHPADWDLAGRRLGLPASERGGLMARGQSLGLLVTGLSETQQKLLAGSAPGFERGRRPGCALLAGSRNSLEAVAEAARASGQAPLGEALERALHVDEPPAAMIAGGVRFEFGARTWIMGIVNVTPDSFSDGGQFLDPARAIAHGEQLAAAGADLLDIGGESTRPGAPRVSADEELSRVLPVVRALKERTGVPISIDTTKAAVAREAIAAGASFVNDISGFGFDPALPKVVAETGAACCLMHIQGTPESMQRSPHYGDLTAEVIEFLGGAIDRAVVAGVPRSQIAVDPGIGFGKTAGHNLFLLRRLADLRVLGQPILVGPSRKAFLGQLTAGKPPAGRVVATAACAAAVALAFGADIVRAHDVDEVGDALAVADAVRAATDGGDSFADTA